MENISCPFCNIEFTEREIILNSENALAIFDKYPVNKGHALIIAKRHCADYFNLSLEEQAGCWSMVNEVKTILVNKYHPDGLNVGININEAAGQTIPHVHIHLIPRYKGDVPSPEGGIRGVIPDNKIYNNK